ncbi:MAG: MBL fold metallo-hydrolase [Clostridia bacterium]|nr:MBL fold metallo-hydrolase [Clostridia bacterium]
MKITAVKYAESVLPESWIFKNGDAQKKLPIVFLIYLIKTQDKLILVDAGCESMPDFNMKNFIGPIKALENIGVCADDITDLIITHSHHDHIECARYFKNALIYIQQDEFEMGRQYLNDCKKIKTFADEYSVCSDVKIVKIGGHSKGSCVVEAQIGDKTYVITGDECYHKKCLDEHILSGAPYNEEKNREFIDKYSSARYVPLVCHDPYNNTPTKEMADIIFFV